MISFTSFPVQIDQGYGSSHLHPISEDISMDEDYDLLESRASRLTCPGESLTSSQAYMRYSSIAFQVLCI